MANVPFSGFGVMPGDIVDMANDIIPINDVSVAAASQNKKITPIELKVALQGLRVPSLTTFSLTGVAAGAVLATVYNPARGLSMVRTDLGTAGERVYFLGKAVPAATGWTATCKMNVSVPIISGSNIYSGGMGLYDSVSGKFIVFGLQYLNGTIKLIVTYYSSLTTFSSDVLATAINQPYPQWFQIIESSTNYTFNYSYDNGMSWLTWTTALKASFLTANRVGVSMNTSTAIGFKSTAVVEHYDDPDIPL